MSEFSKAYKNVSESLASAEGLKSVLSDITQYQAEIHDGLSFCIEGMKDAALSGKIDGTLKGNLAEFWHAGTLKLSSIKYGDPNNLNVEVPKSTLLNSPDMIAADGLSSISAQSKYWATANDSFDQLVKGNYYHMQKIIPYEQLPEIKGIALENYIKFKDINPEYALKCKNILESVDGQFKFGKYSSFLLSNKQAQEIVNEIRNGTFNPKKYGLSIEDLAKWSDVGKSAGIAAFNAAMISALLKSAPHVLFFIKDVLKEGELNINELILAGKDGLKGGATGALMGGLSAGIVSACKFGFLGDALKNVNPSFVSASVVVSINSIINSYNLYKGLITKEQYGDSIIRDTITISCSFGGMAIGQSLIPVPFIGALIGGLVGSILGTVIYEGNKKILISFCLNHDLAIPYLVKQNYTLPKDIMQKCGFDLMEYDEIDYDIMNIDNLDYDIMGYDLMDIPLLKRGLIGFNTLGYTIIR